MEATEETRARGLAPGVRLRRAGVGLALGVALVLVLGEVGTRILTRRLSNGMPGIGPYPLLPFRPTEEVVRGWSRGDPTYLGPDPELGWTLYPSAEGKVNDGLVYRTNAQGFRAAPERVYAPAPPAGRVRVVLAGDSFVHGSELQLEETLAGLLEELCPSIETVNLGVPAYGTDQAFLRWRRDGRDLRAHVVLLGVWPENLLRNLNLARYYLEPDRGPLLAKPRFVVVGGELELVPTPAADHAELARVLSAPEGVPVLEHEFWVAPSERAPRALYRSRLLRSALSFTHLSGRRALKERLYSGQDPRAIDLARAIAGRFAAEVEAAGAIPAVLILPMREHLESQPDDASHPLARALRADGLRVVNLQPAFVAPARELDLFTRVGHLNPRGSRLAAEVLLGELLELPLPWGPCGARGGPGGSPGGERAR